MGTGVRLARASGAAAGAGPDPEMSGAAGGSGKAGERRAGQRGASACPAPRDEQQRPTPNATRRIQHP